MPECSASHPEAAWLCLTVDPSAVMAMVGVVAGAGLNKSPALTRWEAAPPELSSLVAVGMARPVPEGQMTSKELSASCGEAVCCCQPAADLQAA